MITVPALVLGVTVATTGAPALAEEAPAAPQTAATGASGGSGDASAAAGRAS
ncbi:MFS transporter, partial [Leifsonia sp. ku-ls]